jgi:hypothetical protein
METVKMTNLFRAAMLVVLLAMGLGATEGANAKQVWAGGEMLNYDPRIPPKPEEPKEPDYRTLSCKYFTSIPVEGVPYWEAGNYYVISYSNGTTACASWHGTGQLVASWWS